jgi:rSAM/selenodomain-associated transferase 2
MPEPVAAPALSIVIPTLNTARTLGATLAALPNDAEIIVVDGGSSDRTVENAKSAGARLMASPRGRGLQLAAGAAAAGAPWLLFLHADTVLAPGWHDAVARFIAAPANLERAACFRLRLDDESRAARRLERLVAWRTARLGLPYGDQGLLVSRVLYDRVGGYRPLPIMEDVDLARRLGRRRVVMLDAVAVTSAERYSRDGYLSRSARNLFCLGLYLVGVPPRWVARLYAGRAVP